MKSKQGDTSPYWKLYQQWAFGSDWGPSDNFLVLQKRPAKHRGEVRSIPISSFGNGGKSAFSREKVQCRKCMPTNKNGWIIIMRRTYVRTLQFRALFQGQGVMVNFLWSTENFSCTIRARSFTALSPLLTFTHTTKIAAFWRVSTVPVTVDTRQIKHVYKLTRVELYSRKKWTRVHFDTCI